MNENVRIVSDGTAQGTRVLNADGTPIPGVERIEILPLDPNGVVQARVTLNFVELDMVAQVEQK
ncbi:hypothetical protein WL19_03380 [Burkholderia ubonensis]|nr:hypothetical protein WL19_03380 [Burkholderia ubonensis]